MRLPTVILFFALVLVSVSASLRAGASISTVNAVVGDRSAEYFERGPSLEDPSLEDPSREDLSLEDPSLEDPSLEDPSLGRDDERIADHLSFVLERLRKRSARCLDAERARRRTARLDDLERYVTARQFPRHAREGEGRQPRFMDEDGRLCAVGALVAASAGKDEAIRLAAAFEYAFLEDVDDPGLRAWADVNGFSIRELAAIQPAYPMKRKATIERPWLAGLGLGGVSRRAQARRSRTP